MLRLRPRIASIKPKGLYHISIMETVPENTHVYPELKRIHTYNKSNNINGSGAEMGLKSIEYGNKNNAGKIIEGIRNPNFVITKKTSIITKKTNVITEKTNAITEKRRVIIREMTIKTTINTIITDQKAIIRDRKTCNIELYNGKIRQHISGIKKERGISDKHIS